ncbi:tetratricopeptide repeat protein [Lachnospiraceae bacterium WCA-9-b2]|uniref:Tetratricopeptide repeat protein n=2 Tax=Sporofaciens musculi TaxID=2681861 RepID=A0A7X3MGI0_9FIRM|nr:chitobiase/beta-hexosaminidase C-terminal domain-containing protein [Sporofaciens musculi]MXP75966.1 tetratricopeptide repeat protein [Sporofaciens musculi]
MKCEYCGYEIPEGMLYCESCGREVRIVPDYNPLDDMLTEQIRGAINGEDDYIDYGSIRDTKSTRSSTGRNTGRGTNRDMGGVGRSTSRDMGGGVSRSTSRDMRNGASRSTSRDMGGGVSRSTSRDMRNGASRSTSRDMGGGVSRNTGPRRGNVTENMSERDRKRRQAERKKAKRRKRTGCLLVLFLIIAAIAGGMVYLYMNSYQGIVSRGNKALKAGELNQAIAYFERGIRKDEAKKDAYVGLSKVYIAKKDLDWAESIFSEAIKKQPKNANIYQAYVEFYMDTEQKEKIPLLLEDVDGDVAERLAGYIVASPQFSLDDDEVYEDVQELSLTTEEGYKIYYTDDGTEATIRSKEYTEPIQLGEGVNEISALAVDDKGVPGLPVKKTYTVELPIVDAPAVSPSTGQYSSAVQIEIKVPEGYTAYYTTSGEEPSTASSKYIGPIDMPEGETLFKAILVNGKGRSSGVTTRNYVLETQ